MRGDLPQLLIKTGLDLLDEEGTEGLTLRRIAARAGVSHAAPAHHFNGLPGLRTAIATQGFRSFLHELVSARDALPPDADPFLCLLAVNQAYIRFSRRRTALFRLMFDQLPTEDNDLRQAALAAYAILQDHWTPFVGDRHPASFETAIWALTHGFAALSMDRPYPPDTPVNLSSYEDALRLLVG
ncbi:TetR/AcrR family transcriptional regulator [Paracoccus shandongensis]|uniref:TetR/AcrR family transcriptional regulator n=1 Tax=Paracoccus shandongensis TaxID=2816048 RepID=UPI001A90B7B9|nr:TetR/AcrR family transcriptional regulator [Paracoccus shandongensis]